MGFYHKKLRNIEDLKQEKKMLLEESKRMNQDEFLSLEGIMSGSKNGGEAKGGIGSLLDYLPVSNPVVSTIIQLVQKRLSKKDRAPEPAYAPKSEGGKKSKSTIKTVAFEVIGGYLKWKAIELSYKGIAHLIKKRKEKKSAGL